MDKEQALEYATNTIRSVEYMEKYAKPEDFDSMIDLKNCLLYFVSNAIIENLKTDTEKANGR